MVKSGRFNITIVAVCLRFVAISGLKTGLLLDMRSSTKAKVTVPGHVAGYRVGEVLGSGSFGLVVRGFAADGYEDSAVAIKLYDKNPYQQQEKSNYDVSAMRSRISNEIWALENLRGHPNIIHFSGMSETPMYIAIVFELADSGTLLDLMERQPQKCFSEDAAREFFWDIARGIEQAHSRSVVHRDLKLENIFLRKCGSRHRAKIGDWGFAGKYAADQKLSDYCGSLHYAAPEICLGIPYNGPEVDCWSLGVMLFAMLTGRLPFGGTNPADVAAACTKGIYHYRERAISADCRKLIRSLLTVSPDARASIYDVINSRWMNPGLSKPIQPIPSFGLHTWQQQQQQHQQGKAAQAAVESIEAAEDSSSIIQRSPRFWKIFRL